MLVIPGKRKVAGRGVINSLIDKLPFGVHIPGYSFCGPGSDIEHLLDVKGKNKLDDACKIHDIAYWKHSDLETRHKADQKLIESAWNRFKSSDATLGEKAASYLVTNIMKAKLAMGAGLKKQGLKRRKPMKRKIAGMRVIPLPQKGGILQYILPLLAGLSNIGSVASSANDVIKAIQKMRGSGIKQKAVLAPFKKGFGLYLKPYNPNC